MMAIASVGMHDDGSHAGPRLCPIPIGLFSSALIFVLSRLLSPHMLSDEQAFSLEMIFHSQNAGGVFGHYLERAALNV